MTRYADAPAPSAARHSVGVESRQDNHETGGHGGADQGQRFKAVHDWHRQVEQRQVRLLLLGDCDGVTSVARLTDDLETPVALQDHAQEAAQRLDVIGDDDAIKA